MFSAPKTPAPELKPFGVDDSRVATNEEAVPLPYARGRHRLALRWNLGGPYNQRTTEIRQKVGKGSAQTTGYNVYCDIGGLLCHGIVDKIEEVWIDGNQVWTGQIFRDDFPAYYQFEIPQYGTFRIYWGTEDQSKDDLIFATGAATEEIDPDREPWEYEPSNEPRQPRTVPLAGCPDDHPAYLGQCYVVIRQLFCGQDRESVPNVEIVVSTGPSVTGLDPANVTEGANPVSIIAEILTHPRMGGGLPLAAIPAADWLAVALATRRERAFPLDDNPDHVAYMGHLSPLVERETTLRAVVVDLLAHFDGWLRPRNGLLEIGRFPHDGTIPSGLTELSLHDDAELPDYAPGTWEDTRTEVTVICKNNRRGFKEDVGRAVNPAALSVRPERRRETLRRPWIISTYQADEYAAEFAATVAHPRNLARGTVIVRRERARWAGGAPLLPGDNFQLDYEPWALDLIVRITRRSLRYRGQTVQLDWEAERGIAPLAYVPPENNRPDLTLPPPAALTNARAFQLPSAWKGYGPEPAVAILAERSSERLAGYAVWFSSDDATYDGVAKVNQWAVRGALNLALDTTATSIEITATGPDIVKLQPQSAAAQSDNTLLMIVGNEVMSIGSVVAEGGGVYTLGILRARQGSAAASHLTSAGAWIIPRADLVITEHADYPRTTATRYFKLPTRTARDEQPLADALKLTFTFSDTGVAPVTNLAATAVAEGVNLTCDIPNERDITHVGFFERSAASPAPLVTDVPNFTVAAIAGTKLSKLRGGRTPGAALYYWARTYDAISTQSTDVGPESATPTTPPTGATGAPGADGSPGSPGATGSTGNTIERRYRRLDIVPPTPTGDDPGGWTVAMPAGLSALWVSEATKTAAGALVGSWSEPRRLTGNVNFYTNDAPDPAGYTLIEGDIWFDADGGFKGHRYEGGVWVAKLWGDQAIDNLSAGKITAGVVTVAITLTSPRIVGGGVYIESGIGIRYIDNTGVLTITGGQDNGVGNGAQLDLCGIAAPTGLKGVIAMSAGNNAEGHIFFRTGPSADRMIIRHDGKIQVLGSNRFEFTNAGADISYFVEDFGINIYGDATHPVKIRNAALCLGSTAGESKTGGRIYDAAGVQIIRERYSVSEPGAAFDESSAIALANWLRALVLHHGLGA